VADHREEALEGVHRPLSAHRLSNHALALTLGARLGVYDVLASIGDGGMGKVFRARDTRLNRDVAPSWRTWEPASRQEAISCRG
jgi:serine/threonine protein kinase